MPVIGYHASHEQFSPSALKALVTRAEASGFHSAMSSDHFHPWSEGQGQSGFAWAWLGSALEATRLNFGIITAPGWRYHPAIIAQAVGTLLEMYPDRLWLALGSGEAINEHMTGLPWPEKDERNARLLECVQIIRALFAGETVMHRGRVIAIECKLYTRPHQAPLILGAAVTPETAGWVATWADGLITVSAKPPKLKATLDAFRKNGGEGKPVFLKAGLSWAATERAAVNQAHEQWRSNAIGGELSWLLRTPGDFDQASRLIRPEDMHESVLISADLGQHADWLAEYIDMGVEQIYLHNVGRNQEQFIDAFGKKVLPSLAKPGDQN